LKHCCRLQKQLWTLQTARNTAILVKYKDDASQAILSVASFETIATQNTISRYWI